MTVQKFKTPPAFFTSERFVAARDAHLKKLADGQEPSFGVLSRFMRDINRTLLEEFDHRCGYCHSPVGITDYGSVDHFYPKYRFPERAFDWENIVLSCNVCNVAKRDQFPTDAHGNPLLINPRVDESDEHLKLEDDGTLVGLTPKGVASIKTIHLNRAALVAARRRERLYKRLAEQRPELRSALLEDDFHSLFIASITSTRSLNAVTGLSPSTDQSMRYMLHANIITCLETYLGDALIATARSSRRFMRKFVETFHGFKDIKFSLNEVFAKYDTIDEVAIRAMADVLYHDLAKVKGIYQDTLGIIFPTDIGDLYRAVDVRHDIVHRNGKNKDGVFHAISPDSVEKLAEQVSAFIAEIHRQIADIRQQLGDES